ncbi:thiamine-phosphate pyrophosphorylase [Chelatococcus caeni]|uniref:Thiamine-phosphate pyrophosphorylase n=1 Tax=Chelatococcus caeni TaxID=1348468 RepID=A0A840BXF1_9HYPH|nr:thiamine phosphate synthase [Chelatococcus caeni]MBB4018191.1 thiamine-phosphate pyrophosphorylase [Chelatococcus caeni]
MSDLTPRLYLVSPLVTDVEAFAPQLEAACKVGDIAAVLLRLATSDERAAIKQVKALAPIAQNEGAAVVVAGAPVVAIRGGADGVHITGTGSPAEIAAAREALEAMKPDRIVGIGGLRGKHDAMVAGEMDIDYVMFGEPLPNAVLPPFAQVVERAAWWAEIFAVPCVAFAPTLEDVTPLAETGVEFVAVGDAVWSAPEGPAKAVACALGALASAEVPQR